MHSIPNIIIPIIENATSRNKNLRDELQDKRAIIFGVPGAFTPTCSEQHLPSYLKLSNQIKSQGVSDIYCMSVNDAFVMKAWLSSYKSDNKVIGISDGNGDFTKKLSLLVNYSRNFMNYRCKRFSLIAKNNKIVILNVEKKGKYYISSAEYILNLLTKNVI